YDMVFCDADPASYPDYLSAGQRLLRNGGIIVFDDAGGAGGVADVGTAAAGTRELAEMVRIDDRLVPLSIPVAGGLLAAIKH
ncbi:MAG TPA: methyltransferase, partial [Trebonia sp.]